jgi:hypothetical protein
LTENSVARERAGVLTVRGQLWGGDEEGAERVLTTRVGLCFPDRMSFEGWERAGRRVFDLHDSSSWCLGDWLIYGQEMYADRYKRAIEMAGLDYQTLRNYAWVARRFELSRRREKLSFQHHAEVVPLPVPDQEDWLDRAEQGGWSRNELRRQVRLSKDPAARLAGKHKALPELAASSEQISRWHQAADQLAYPLDEWVVDVLDRAASEVLQDNGNAAN